MLPVGSLELSLTSGFRYLAGQFLVSRLLQHSLLDRVSHLCHYKWQPLFYNYK